MEEFDPNGVGVKGTLFALPYTVDEAEIVVLPVPWDVTVSYGSGTAQAPNSILDSSSQIDYFTLKKPKAWQTKVAMTEIPEVWESLGTDLRLKAEQYIEWIESGSPAEQAEAMSFMLDEINQESAQLVSYVQQETNYYLAEGKRTILLGGDHSTPLGHMQAVFAQNQNEEIGLLQIDAHADLREAYEGFTHSHASIMWNALQKISNVKLVQVGIRDLCEAEADIIKSDERITCFYNEVMNSRLFNGEYWSVICKEVVHALPQKVYISLDIDGLSPEHCPNTGTPVPGGLSFDQLVFLFNELKASGKEIVGADLVEVGQEAWDANVGARMLWQLVQLIK